MNNNLKQRVEEVVKSKKETYYNPSKAFLIVEAVHNREAITSRNGALASWTPAESTGRSPKDTVIVKRLESQVNIDWMSPNNLPIKEEIFDMVFEDALEIMKDKKNLYVTERTIGADSRYALPVTTVTDRALGQVFAKNMFRHMTPEIKKSVFYEKDFTLIVLPYDKLDKSKYGFKLRMLPDGTASDMIVAMDLDRRVGIIIGSLYLGSMKKLMFTVMNYYLPFEGILPLHCSANEGNKNDTTLLLGLSGTGKTTLSADPTRALLGDDEHGWSDDGIFNFENGCYAKMIDINPKKEPDIYKAVMHKDDYKCHGSIVENAMIYPDGTFDFNDERMTPNSRASYPLNFLDNIKESSTGGHPKTILFLTADAYGVLPPVARLNRDQARLWFLMGYTSKLAGTETGIVSPQATFSRFFGQPFMPLNPEIYSKMLGDKMEKHNTNVYLINTGWTGGKYGVGKRIDINYTRMMVNAAISGELEKVEYITNDLFHISVPLECPGVPSEILQPINTWKDTQEFKDTAQKLAKKFSSHFDNAYGKKGISEEVIRQCPGK